MLAGAEQVDAPVVLLVPPAAAARTDGVRLVSLLRALADGSAVPVCIQLDHATDLDLIGRAVEAGADAVLADGSALPLAENVALVREVRRRWGTRIAVEAELGALPGDEDRARSSAADTTTFTDPGVAARFVEDTGAGLLAVSVGNVHGRYRGTPRIDHRRLTDLRSRLAVPLVLHGASGIPPEELRRAAVSGVGKVNVNTELRGVLLDALQNGLPAARDRGDDVAMLAAGVAEAVGGFAASTLGILRTGVVATRTAG